MFSAGFFPLLMSVMLPFLTSFVRADTNKRGEVFSML
jgi:hypothetical protein